MQGPADPGRRPDAAIARARYRQRAAHYDLELAPFEPVRRQAIEMLAPQVGDTVLDIGCGTGLSFAPLLERIGPTGRIVGVDPSPDMLAQARTRVARHGWSGVALVEAPAHRAPLQRHADAALFHFTHDVLRDPAALDHVLAHLKPGAQVVASGLQWSPPWMLPTNLFVLGAALYSVSTLEGLQQPWTMLARRLQSFEVRSFPWVGIYVARGRVAVTSRA
jgi:demethylmenaquinone methyltransferase/2-methoxy-6-polyprenyl-1,4-benzoquinol methylase